MDEALINTLRWVLLSDETGWRDELDRALREVAMRAGGLEEVAVFLADRYEAADPTYQPRMYKMIEHVRRQSASLKDVGDVVPGLAAEYLRLDREVEELEARLHALRGSRAAIGERLLEHLEPGGARDLLGFRFEHAAAGEELLVRDPTLLPLELTVPAADLPAIQQWAQMHGRLPRGVERRATPARVVIVQRA